MAAVIITAALTAPSAYAQPFTVVDNLSEPDLNATGFGTGNLLGQYIRTGATGGTLESITLPLRLEYNDPYTVSLTLRAYNSTSFGAILTTFAPQTVTSKTITNIVFTPTTTYGLTSNTAYWVVAGVVEGNDARWSYTESFTNSGEGSLENNPTTAGSINGGNSFSVAFPFAPQRIQVLANNVVVPEASTAALLGLALPVIGAFVIGRHKQK